MIAENDDLFVVSTGGTGSGRVEVHSLTAGSNYQDYHITTATPITFDEAFDCRFLLGPYRRSFLCESRLRGDTQDGGV